MTRICPCCKRPISTIPIDQLDTLDAIPKPKQQQTILDALVGAYPKHISISDLVLSVWQQEGQEEPEYAESSVCVQLHRLRKLIKHTSWRIENSWSVGYRLVRLEGL